MFEGEQAPRLIPLDIPLKQERGGERSVLVPLGAPEVLSSTTPSSVELRCAAVAASVDAAMPCRAWLCFG
jgi:hypothetical protein